MPFSGLYRLDAWAAPTTSVFVEVSSAKLRKEPLHWSIALKDLSYGQKLEVISQERSWYLVSSEGISGYVHQTAVTSRKVILQSADNKALLEATDTDVVLAGKGFSQEIESLYLSQNPELDMAAVDRLERFRVDPLSLQRFLRQGQLIEQEVG